MISPSTSKSDEWKRSAFRRLYQQLLYWQNWEAKLISTLKKKEEEEGAGKQEEVVWAKGVKREDHFWMYLWESLEQDNEIYFSLIYK